MSFALGLGPGRPTPAGILALSGFIPTVEGWKADLDRPGLPVFLAHGRLDPVISVDFARAARERLEGAGLPLTYRETDAAHQIDPRAVHDLPAWIEGAASRTPAGG
jgi:phospholipase/carboxylesterase